MTDPTDPAPEAELVEDASKERTSVLESDQRLSDSVIWNLQRQFYDRKGIEAWSQNIVPNFITTNPRLARNYAKVVQGYLRDLALDPEQTLVKTEPIYLFELGSGTGRFCFFFMRALKELLARDPLLRGYSVCYVVTDFTSNNVGYWRDHPGLQPFLEDGSLEYALFGAHESYEELELMHSGRRLQVGTLQNPVCMFANYFFCVVEQDAFRVGADGELNEAVITTYSPQEEPDPDDPGLIMRIHNSYNHVPVDADTRYADPALGAILHEYVRELREPPPAEVDAYASMEPMATCFLVPLGSAKCIETLGAFCAGPEPRMLVIASDKGYNQIKEMRGRWGYPKSIEGSFSFMANLHALGVYCRAKGGASLHTGVTVEAQGDTCLASAAFVLGSPQATLDQRLALTVDAFAEYFEQFGPCDYYELCHTMQAYQPGLPGAPEDGAGPDVCNSQHSLQQLLAVWRASYFDPFYFWQMKSRLLILVETASLEERLEVERAIYGTYQNFYHIGETEDLPFELGRVCYQMHLFKHESALAYYRDSVKIFGDHNITAYNLGLCHKENGNYADALEYFRSSIAQDDSYEPAVKALEELEERLRPAAPGPPGGRLPPIPPLSVPSEVVAEGAVEEALSSLG